MKKIKFIFFITMFVITNTIGESINIQIKLKVNNTIITNIDIENEKRYLLFLNPNVIGFRGAICKTKDRNSDICFQKVKNLSQSINFEISKAQETAGACIEA